MKILLFTLTMAVWLTGNFASIAQETEPKNNPELTEQLADLLRDKESMIKQERVKLKNEVAAINSKLERNQITATEAESLKVEAANKAALNIENKAAIIDNHIALLERNGALDDSFSIEVNLGENNSKEYVNSHPVSARTSGALTFAIGLNNVIIEGQSLNDSPYRIGGSKFLELGYTWATRVFEDSNWLRVKYGFSFQFNGLKFEDNNFLVANGDGTNSIEEFPEPLDKAKFRMDNLVIPVHFEFGPSKTTTHDGKKVFSNHSNFKMGLGGYAGVNLSTLQKLKFEQDGNDVKTKIRDGYNTNNFVYGLSGYVGWDTMSLYVKYDLNPIFKTGAEQRNISAGFRFDFN